MEVNIIILYISVVSFIFSLVLLLIQGIYNCVFLYSSSRINIIERLLFEQFSYEVYSSINTPLSYDFPTTTEQSQCYYPYKDISFNLNLDSFYDCRGISSSDLEDPQCRNKIITDTTICTDSDTTIDPREKYCTYFSNFTQKIAFLDGKRICLSYKKIYYEELLSYSLPLYDLEGKVNQCDESKSKRCGILDTMNNILCFPDIYYCPTYEFQKSTNLGIITNDSFFHKVIVSVIVSENQPLNHEWDIIVREEYEKLNEKKIYERKVIGPTDFKLFDEEYDNTYEKQGNISISVGPIINQNNVKDKGYDRNKNLSIYTRNYIGFKNVKELTKFKKYFKQNNYRDNPLYRLSSSYHHNPIITIVFSVVFLILSILYIIFSHIKLIDQIFYFKIFFVIIDLFFIGNLIIIIYHSIRCPLIHIEMDQRMQKVLDAYNKKTSMFQLFRYIATLFNLASFVLCVMFFYKDNQQGQNQNQNQGNNPVSVPQNDNPN